MRQQLQILVVLCACAQQACSIIEPISDANVKGSTNFNGDFTGRFPSDLKYAKDSVTSIDLRKMPPGHGVYGSLPTQLGRFRVLTSVRVQQNDVAGTLPTQIGALAVPLTERLEVWGNAEMGGPVPTQLGSLRGLTGSLVLDGPRGWQGQLPSEIGQLSLLEDRLVLTNPRGGATATATATTTRTRTRTRRVQERG